MPPGYRHWQRCTGVSTSCQQRVSTSAARTSVPPSSRTCGLCTRPGPTERWSNRILSGVTRAELVLHGLAVFGPPPPHVLSPMDQENVREAARAELLGYWAWAVRRPWLWLDPVLADLGLTSMARGRHSLATGELLTKTRAGEQADAPARVLDELRARRQGEDVTSPRLRTALTAWRDARRTVALAHGALR